MSEEIIIEGCLDSVFNFKLGRFAKQKINFVTVTKPLLELKNLPALL